MPANTLRSYIDSNIRTMKANGSDNKFNLQDQVVVREKVYGRNLTKIRVGHILAFKDDKTAVVLFPDPRKHITEKKEFPISSLESVQNKFGRTRVQYNSIYRNLGQLMSR